MKNLQTKKHKKPSQFIYLLTIAGSVTFLIVISLLISLSLGFMLDKFFHTSPLFLSIGAIVGFIGSIINILQLVKTMK